ncbi:MAG: two-component system response regulator [Methanolinea sp. SDB]|nr:MAG: two-component system response regulator [Methanolinea sp. SDB]
MVDILLVDDSEMARFLLKQILVSGGHTIVGEAGDGEECIQKVRHLSPQMVILDLVMPKMRGIETLKVIREIDPSIKVVICSGDHQEFSVRDAVKFGASGYIIKPFHKAAVLEEVRDIMNEAPADDE